MKICIADFVKNCAFNEDGDIVFSKIYPLLAQGRQVTVSFKGIDGVSASFVNSALIPLLEHFDFENIKKNLNFIDSTRQINEMIKKRFFFEVGRTKDKKNEGKGLEK